MKFKLLFLLVIIVRIAIAQNANKDKEIVIGELDHLYSNILKEDRRIWVYVPNGPNPATNESERFPVVYLLDGDGHFFSTMGILYHLSHLLSNTPCPKMIIVGIRNTDRTRDLTPSHARSHPGIDTSELVSSGGGENFLAFIEKELVPHVDSLYPTTSYKMFVGHSLGGLAVMNALINHTDFFNSYLAIDPSMNWDGSKLLKQSKEVLQQKKFTSKTLFVAKANNDDPAINPYQNADEKLLVKEHNRSMKQLHEYLAANDGKNGLRWKYKYYPEETHGSSPLPAEYDAFKFIFDFYRFNSVSRLWDPQFNGDSAIAKHYQVISDRMGYTVFPPEPLLNDVGYMLFEKKSYKRAYGFLKMNVDNHPNSWNGQDSLGDLYDAMGEKEKAIACYQKALSLHENAITREKLDALQKGK